MASLNPSKKDDPWAFLDEPNPTPKVASNPWAFLDEPNPTPKVASNPWAFLDEPPVVQQVSDIESRKIGGSMMGGMAGLGLNSFAPETPATPEELLAIAQSEDLRKRENRSYLGPQNLLGLGARGALDIGAGGSSEGVLTIVDDIIQGTRKVGAAPDLLSLNQKLEIQEEKRRAITNPVFNRGEPINTTALAEVDAEIAAQKIEREAYLLSRKSELDKVNKSSYLEPAMAKVGEFRQAVRDVYPVDADVEASIPGQTITALGQVVSQIPLALTGLGIPAVVGQMFDQTYQEALKAGKSKEIARAAGYANMPMAALEQLGNVAKLKTLRAAFSKNPTQRAATDLLEAIAIEGGTEGAQQIGGNVVARKYYDPKRDVFEGVPTAALVGGIAGGVTSAAGIGAGRIMGSENPENLAKQDPRTLFPDQKRAVQKMRRTDYDKLSPIDKARTDFYELTLHTALQDAIKNNTPVDIYELSDYNEDATTPIVLPKDWVQDGDYYVPKGYVAPAAPGTPAAAAPGTPAVAAAAPGTPAVAAVAPGTPAEVVAPGTPAAVVAPGTPAAVAPAPIKKRASVKAPVVVETPVPAKTSEDLDRDVEWFDSQLAMGELTKAEHKKEMAKIKKQRLLAPAIVEETPASAPLAATGTPVTPVVAEAAPETPVVAEAAPDTPVAATPAPAPAPAAMATPAPAAPVAATPAPAPALAAEDPVLPRTLRSAKTYYKQSPIEFTSDLDLALYIVSSKTPSKQRPAYLAWIKKSTGLTEAQAISEGAKVRTEIAKRHNDSPSAPISLPVTSTRKNPVRQSTVAATPAPAPAPAKKPRRVAKTVEDFILPKILKAAKTFYRKSALNFTSDLDLALYIVSSKKPSKQRPAYLDWVMKSTGLTEAQAISEGAKIRTEIAKRYDDSSDAPISLPVTSTRKNLVRQSLTEDPSHLTLSDDISTELWFARFNVQHARRMGFKPSPSDLKIVLDNAPIAELQEQELSKTQRAEQTRAEAELEVWKKDNPQAPKIIVVYRPEWVQNNRGVQGQHSVDGGIVINAAYALSGGSTISRVASHEYAHSLISSLQGQEALQNFAARSIPEDQMAALQKKYPRQRGETEIEYNLKIAEEWIARNAETQPGVFQAIVEAMRGWLAKAGLVNLSNEEVARAMLRVLRSSNSDLAERESAITRQSLTDRAAVLDSPNFKRWFGNSKMVDEDGNPKVFYHGTTSGEDFSTFDGGIRGVIFVSPSPEVADYFALSSEDNDNARVFPLYVRAENPFEFWNNDHLDKVLSRQPSKGSSFRERVSDGSWAALATIIDDIKAAGFDSYYEMEMGQINLGVFDPNQLKSSVSNTGEYSRTNNDVAYSLTDESVNDRTPIDTPKNQTKSPEFKRWFGSSKVVDKNGNPLVVYHGTMDPSFTVFNTDRGYSFGPAAYFSPDPKKAVRYSGMNYAEDMADTPGATVEDIEGEMVKGKTPAVYPVYVSVKNPISSAKFEALPGTTNNERNAEARKRGYDGVIKTWPANSNRDEVIVEIAVFSPTQIKSATGNRGTFDPTNPDIRQSLTDEPVNDRTPINTPKINTVLTPEEIAAVDKRQIRDLDISYLLRKGILTERHAKMLSELRYTSGGNARIEVVNADELPPRAMGAWDGKTNRILLSRDSKMNLGRVLLHEYVHALTFMGLRFGDAVRFNSRTGERIDAKPRLGVSDSDLREASEQMDKLFSIAEKTARDQGKKFYGLTNREEFVAEAFSSKKFQNFLSSIPSTNGGKQSLFDQFIAIVKKILGTENDSLLTDVITATDPFVGATKRVSGTLMVDERFSLTDQTEASDVDDRISTRNPTAKRATENPLTQQLSIDLDSISRTEGALSTIVDTIGLYPGIRFESIEPADKATEFIRFVVDNLLYLHDSVPVGTRKRSRLWYDGARKLAEKWSVRFDIERRGVAGVIAALSPQMDWYKNVKLAERVLEIVRDQQNTVFSGPLEQWARTKLTADSDPKRVVEDEVVARMVGKKFSRLSTYEKAVFVRAFDEVNNSKTYQILSPEGRMLDLARNKNGRPAEYGWPSFAGIARAVGIAENPTRENISELLGTEHKVRSFYNNILLPNNPEYGDVTIDTHAVAAALLLPLSSTSTPVNHNFGKGAPKSKIVGTSGVYGLYAEAYRIAAKERGILPREMQSITWEAVRGLFKPEFKRNAANRALINNLWGEYKNGKATIDETRQLILQAAGGINEPSWVGSVSGPVTEDESTSDSRELSSPVLLGGSGTNTGRGSEFSGVDSQRVIKGSTPGVRDNQLGPRYSLMDEPISPRFTDVQMAWNKGEMTRDQYDEAMAELARNPEGINFPAGGPPVDLALSMDRAAPGTDIVDLPTVYKSIIKVLQTLGDNAVIRTGRYSGPASGLYKEFENVIRLRRGMDRNGLPVVVHELGHSMAKSIFGTAKSSVLRRALRYDPKNAPVVKELEGLGKNRYGSTRPAIGYTGEGFAEFVRLWMTDSPELKNYGPTRAWFEKTFIADDPNLGASLDVAKKQLTLWALQGSLDRGRAMSSPPKALDKLRYVYKKQTSKAVRVEEFDPLELISKEYVRRTGTPMRADISPIILASALRGTAGGVLNSWVELGITDIYGKVVGPSLKEAYALIKPSQKEDFRLYLVSLQSQIRLKQGKDPGMYQQDADNNVAKLSLKYPHFAKAALDISKWWDKALDYQLMAFPEMNYQLTAAIRAANPVYYGPLMRQFTEEEKDSNKVKGTSYVIKEAKGSARKLEDLFTSSLRMAEGIIAKAQKDMVLKTVTDVAKIEGMGYLVTKVEVGKIMRSVNIESIRKQLEIFGVDTSMLSDDAMLEYATNADARDAKDPIIAIRRSTPTATDPNASTLEWYEVTRGIADVLQGVQDVGRLGPAFEILVGAPNRLAKLGLISASIPFQLITNPIRDAYTLFMAAMNGNAIEVGVGLLKAYGKLAQGALVALTSKDFRDAYLGGLGESEISQIAKRLGLSNATFLGGDIQEAKRLTTFLFRGKVFTTLANPLDSFRSALSFSEQAPRLSQLEIAITKLGWKSGDDLTPEQAIAGMLAYKRATVDFSAKGSEPAELRRGLVGPFYGAIMQGSRTLVRTFTSNPKKTAVAFLTGLTTMTLPAILSWYKYKDEEWWKELPLREKGMYWHIVVGDEVVQIPLPQDFGTLFVGLPIAILDAIYNENPDIIKVMFEQAGQVASVFNPVGLPISLKAGVEAYSNRSTFFDSPIVPGKLQRAQPGSQFNRDTGMIAKELGELFPSKLSPIQIETFVKTVAGSVGLNSLRGPELLAELIGLKTKNGEREKDASDTWFYGKIFRKGGKVTSNAISITEFFDDFERLNSRKLPEDEARKTGETPLNPLTTEEVRYYTNLKGRYELVTFFMDMARNSDKRADRQTNMLKAVRLAREGLDEKPKDPLLPW